MKLVKLGMVCGALLLAACGGDDGTPGVKGDKGDQGEPGGVGSATASLSLISPARLVAGRTIQIAISGNNTAWDDAAKPNVSFGEGVTVHSVEVASPTALIVNVTADPMAPAGVREVKVGEQTYKGFQVLAPIEIALEGDLAQGSLFLADITNNDKENPFDDSSSLFGGYTAFNSALFDGDEYVDSILASPLEVTPSSAFVLFAVGVNAPVKELDLVTVSGTSQANAVSAVAQTPVSIAARQAVPMGDVALAAGLHSQLFSYEAAADGMIAFNFIPSGNTALDDVGINVLPESGDWADQLGSLNTVSAGEKFYIVAVGQGDTALTGKIIARSLAGTAFAEVEPNEELETANEVTLPVEISGEIVVRDDKVDLDHFSFTATEGGIYFVDQLPGSDYKLDGQLVVYGPDGEVVAEADDAGNAGIESLVFQAEEAGTYTVLLTGYSATTLGQYKLYISAAP